MIRRKRPEMAISNAELLAMTKTMDEQHEDQSVPALNAAVAEWTDAIRTERAEQSGGHSRRTFILGAGGVAAAGTLLAACGSSKSKTSTGSNSGTGGGSNTGTGSGSSSSLSTPDAQSIAVDASIENLAIFAYTAGLTAAKAGKLGTVPPAVPVFVETALRHHKAHAAAFNAVLTSAGQKAVMDPTPKLTPVVKSMFAKVTTIPELGELAVLLENVAAQSYQDDAASITNAHARAVAATIMPVEMTHAAILYFVLGKYPGAQMASGTPVAFNPLSSAVSYAGSGLTAV